MLDEEVQFLLDEADEHMHKTLEHLRTELGTIRAGRASPAMLETVRVDYYGSQMPLNQVASASAPQPDLLVVQPWDKSALAAIEKGIKAANLGVNPSNDGNLIRIPVPPPSEERRKELAKTARHRGEEAKVAIRNTRRHIKDQIKVTQQENSLSEDVRFAAEEQLQKLTDDYIARIDHILEKKEAEIMEV
ncbi:MAG TPA: ribosome recycling factor [Rhodothermales bacterium]|nr:ribosome recycling factor [Rhodothermales bacterium]